MLRRKNGDSELSDPVDPPIAVPLSRQGPEGEKGEQGVQGLQGNRGKPGQDGVELPDSLRLQVYREEIRGNIEAFGSALSAMWKAILVITVVGLLSIAGSVWNREEILNSREYNYKGRMVNCLDLLVDDDRDFPIPAPCLETNVARYYPTEICERKLVGPVRECGTFNGDE